MKVQYFAVVFGLILALQGCADLSLADSRPVLKMPPLPDSWGILLGEPHWRLEWLDERGRWQSMTVQNPAGVEISVPATWASAVSASPFWPEKGIRAGVFMPAGAIFPFDAIGKTLPLSWQGGVDANLFWEMARLSDGAGEEEVASAAAATARAAVRRLPYNFNWPRFRRLFDDESVNRDVRADPWLADWSGIAAKIVESGFDKRRLVPQQRGSMEISVGAGPWVGVSPFAAPVVFKGTPVFPVRPAIDTWVSAEGILRCNSEAWVLSPW